MPAYHADEHTEQTNLFKWADLAKNARPELEMLFAIPNGGARPTKEVMTKYGVRRFSSVAKRLKDEGVKAGVPDVMLAVARRGFHGLFIEMKVGKNKPTDEQKKWHRKLLNQGYWVETRYSWTEAVDTICWYLDEDFPFNPIAKG
jgi:hypothetical protein